MDSTSAAEAPAASGGLADAAVIPDPAMDPFPAAAATAGGGESLAAPEPSAVITAALWRGAVVRLSQPAKPKLRLLTIPYIAGNSAAFRSWPRRLGGDIEVLSVQLPAAGANLDALVAAAGKELLAEMDVPYAIYGHSLGALVAFELVRWLRQAGAPQPVHLFPAGYCAPQLPSPLAPRLRGWPEDILSSASEAALAPHTRHLLLASVAQSPRRLSAAMPAIRAGLEIVRRYRYREQPVLSCPITCFAGADDPVFAPDSIAPWAAQTDGAFRMVVVPGPHLFVRTQRHRIIAEITGSLASGRSGRFEGARA